MNAEDWIRASLALAVVLALAAGIGWAARRMGLGNVGFKPGRRLALIEAMMLDNRRRLVLIRRDDTEHLLLIGGESDIVVETRIVSATEQRNPPS